MNTQQTITELETIDHFSRLIYVARAAVDAAASYAELEDDRGARWRNTYDSTDTALRLCAVCEVRDLLVAIGEDDTNAIGISEAENGPAFVRAAHAAGISFGLLES
jgi:hypothetical protein